MLYLPNFSLVFLIHVFLYAGVYCTKYLQKVSNSDLDMDNHKIKDMAQPTDDNDAVNKHYVDHNFLNRLTPNALGGELDMYERS